MESRQRGLQQRIYLRTSFYSCIELFCHYHVFIFSLRGRAGHPLLLGTYKHFTNSNIVKMLKRAPWQTTCCIPWSGILRRPVKICPITRNLLRAVEPMVIKSCSENRVFILRLRGALWLPCTPSRCFLQVSFIYRLAAMCTLENIHKPNSLDTDRQDPCLIREPWTNKI